MRSLPKLRRSDIVVQELPDEILIYDLKAHQAFCLNSTCAEVYRACSDQLSLAELIRRRGWSDDVIYLALDQLRQNGLLDGSTTYHSPFEDLSRRRVIRRIGLGGMAALPVIASLVAPRALHAASPGVCVHPGGAAPGTNLGGGRGHGILQHSRDRRCDVYLDPWKPLLQWGGKGYAM